MLPVAAFHTLNPWNEPGSHQDYSVATFNYFILLFKVACQVLFSQIRHAPA